MSGGEAQQPLPKVSVIVPVYNVSEYLDRFIESLFNQTFDMRQVQVIMVDDGSTDDSAEIINSYIKKGYRIISIHKPNGGAASARNAGLKIAKGNYIAFLDPDDYIERDYLEIAYKEAVRTGADIVLFDAFREKTDSSEVCVWNHAREEFVTTDRDDITSMRCQILYPYMNAQVGKISFEKDIPLSAPWDKLYRRKFLDTNNLKFPEELRVLDDMCFNFEAFGKTQKIAYVPIPLYHYLIQEGTVTSGYKADRAELDMKAFEFVKKEIDRGGEQGELYDLKNTAEDVQEHEDHILLQAYYARIIKSFAICCKLSFFNPKSPLSKVQQLEQVTKYLNISPYTEALQNINPDNLEWKLVIFTIAARLNKPRLLKALNSLQSVIT